MTENQHLKNRLESIGINRNQIEESKRENSQNKMEEFNLP